MADFDVLTVVHPGDSSDVLYPVVGEHFVPVFEERDRSGLEIRSYDVHGIYILNDVDGDLKIYNGAADLRGTLWVTGQRLAVVCRNYDKVRWDRSNNMNAAIFGLGLEITDHLLTKAYHKVTSVGKAMAGHLYYPWISSVSWKPAEGRKNRAVLRFGFERELKAGGKRKRYLELRFGDEVDASRLAQDVVQQMSTWWLGSGLPLTDQQKASLKSLESGLTLNAPAAGRLSVYSMPQSALVLPRTTPAAFAGRLSQQQEQLAQQQERSAKGEEYLARFRESSHLCRPPCELVELTEQAGDVACSLGVTVNKAGGLVPAPNESVLLHCIGQAYGTFRSDPQTKLPSVDGAFRPLYQGMSQVMITDRQVTVACGGGTCALGTLTPDKKRVFVASTPLDRLASVGMVQSGLPGRTEPDIGFLVDDPAWGGTWIATVNGEIETKPRSTDT